MIINLKNTYEQPLEVTASRSVPISCTTVISTASTGIELTLPDAIVYPGKKYTFKQAASGSVTIQTVSAQLIDDAVSRVLNEVNATITIMSDGIKWHILDAGSVSIEESKVDYFTVDATDESNGYVSLSKAIGAAGEKNFIVLFLIGGSSLKYGTHYTAMNNDANDSLKIIFKSSGLVSGIATPVYPTDGEDIYAGQQFMVMYVKNISSEMNLQDTELSTNYKLVVSNGILLLEEV